LLLLLSAPPLSPLKAATPGTLLKINGLPVIIGVNAYIKPER
jgi:hypothetical protein